MAKQQITSRKMIFLLLVIVCFLMFPLITFAVEYTPYEKGIVNDLTNNAQKSYTSEAESIIYGNLDQAFVGAGISQDARSVNAAILVGGIIRGVLGLLSVALVVLLVWAGYIWATAGGNSDKVTKARSMVTNGMIGIVLMLSAYAITDFSLNRILSSSARSMDSATDSFINQANEADTEKAKYTKSTWAEQWSFTVEKSGSGDWSKIGNSIKKAFTTEGWKKGATFVWDFMKASNIFSKDFWKARGGTDKKYQ